MVIWFLAEGEMQTADLSCGLAKSWG